IMYELFCGQPMFRGRSFGEYVRKHLTEMPVPPSQTKPGANIDPGLEALILKSLAKDPNERFAHILELRDALLHLLGSIETHPPTVVALSQSAGRRATLPVSALPLPPPAMTTTVPTPPATHASVHYSQYSVPPEAPPEPITPWWVWFVGGACAVGIGI